MNTQLGYVKHFKELEVYRRQREMSRLVFQFSKQFPSEEKYSLTDQIRRAARSVGAQIAEAWAKRLYPKHFISKLSDADGEQLETQHWIIVAMDSGYLADADAQSLLAKCEEVGRMLGSMMRKADSFSSTTYTLQEAPPPYLANLPFEPEALDTDH